MARAPCLGKTLLRRNLRAIQISNTHLRYVTVESTEKEFSGEKLKLCHIQEPLSESSHQSYTDIVAQVCKIIRTRPRWERTLLSDFPSFNFSDPLFFRELLREQRNVLLSLRFFYWLRSHYDFSPDPVSCNVLFDSLVESKACEAAKCFLDGMGCSPEPDILERYVRCLFEGGLVEEAVDVFSKLEGIGVCPSIETWNSAFTGCLKVGRTDLVWKLYQEMMESRAVAEVNLEIAECLIQAFCNDGKVSKGYELLRQLLEDGLEPGNVIFNKLIAGFCKDRNYTRMSEVLHIMIAKNRVPDIYTYQEVINGLCKKRKPFEAYQVLNDLKDRGYAPDRVMYTTMIHGLCKMGRIADATKLWFEMINKGFLPNEFTYSTLVHGYYKTGHFLEAKKLYKEMCGKGYGETIASYNVMIAGLCLHGSVDEASDLFEEMALKGIAPDVITYNTLIQGFCKDGKIDESKNVLKKLLLHGLQPSSSSYAALIEKLCQMGDVQEAKRLWHDMESRGVEPMVCIRDHIIAGLCEQGCVMEGMEWLVIMLKNKLKPQKATFERLVECLTQGDRLDDSLSVLDFMFRLGYALEEGICHSLVTRLCEENSNFVGTYLDKILERN